MTRVVLYTIAVLLVCTGCEREPEDPLQAFLYQLDKKAETLFEHMENADKIMRGEFTAGTVSQDTKFYRYKAVGPAAMDVYNHFASPTMVFYLALTTRESIDPEWTARLKATVAAAQTQLEEQVKAFRKRMPREAREPKQDTELGSAFSGGLCGRGSLYGMSDICLRGKYGYDDEDRLYFHVKGGQLHIEGLFDIDIDHWINSMRGASD